MPDPTVGDCIPSALDEAYCRYSDWCRHIQIRPASFTTWVRAEQGLNPASVAKGTPLQSPQQKRRYQLAHAQEIAAKREAALRALGIA